MAFWSCPQYHVVFFIPVCFVVWYWNKVWYDIYDMMQSPKMAILQGCVPSLLVQVVEVRRKTNMKGKFIQLYHMPLGNFGYFHYIPKTHIVFTHKTIFNVHGKPLSNNPWMPYLLATAWLVEHVYSTPKLVKNTNLWLVNFPGIFTTEVSSLCCHT